VEIPHTEKKKFSAMRFARNLVLIILGTVLLLCLGVAGLVYHYSDQIKKEFIAKINSHLNTEVRVKPHNIDVTFFSTFPDCALQFRNLLILEPAGHKKRDTLLFCGRADLCFSITDLLAGRYRIKRISIANGCLYPEDRKGGKNNYTIWKTDTPSSDTGAVHFRIRALQLKNMKLHYHDEVTEIMVRAKIGELDLAGDIEGNRFEIEGALRAGVEEVKQKDQVYAANRDLSTQLLIRRMNDHYEIPNAVVNAGDARINAKVKFDLGAKFSNLSFVFDLKPVSLVSARTFIPRSQQKYLENYSLDGSLRGDGKFLLPGNGSDWTFACNFEVTDARIGFTPKNLEAKHTFAKGKLTLTPKSELLAVDSLTLLYENQRLSAAGTVTDFDDPYLRIRGGGELQLASVRKLISGDSLQKAEGMLLVSARLDGPFREIRKDLFSEHVLLEANAMLHDANFIFAGNSVPWTINSASLSVQNRHVIVRDLDFVRGKSRAVVNGELPGLFNYVSGKGNLSVKASLLASTIAAEDFIFSKSSKNSEEQALLPAGILLDLDAKVEKFSLGKFHAEDISGKVFLQDRRLLLSDVKMNVMYGKANIDLLATQEGKDLRLDISSELESIDIAELFYQLNDFNQSTLSYRHLKGNADASVAFSGRWSSKMEPDLNSIEATCKIRIVNGGLNEFQPLLNLSKYLDIEDLRRIRFNTLESNIAVKNGTIVIPKTTIANSALNIDLWGSHTFDNRIEYHIRLLLSEYLAKKSKQKEDEFGPVDSDTENRRCAHILMSGTVDNPVIRFDRQGLKQKIREDLKKEKENLLKVLNEEFAFLKKEQAVKTETQAAEAVFELEKEQQQKKSETSKKKKKQQEEPEDY
jgi:hypothetical protein